MESILLRIGPFGKYQKLCTLVVGLISIMCAMTVYSTVFILAEPKIKCVDLITNQTLSNSSNQCDLWESKNKTNYECHFESNIYGSTIVTDWNLICNKSIYASLIQTFYLIGTFLSLTMGYLADKYGRKKISLLTSIIITLLYFLNDIIDLNSLSISTTTRYVIYSISQVINGTMNLSIFSITFILLFEITSSKYHTIVSNINLYIYVLGEFLICLISYLSRDWLVINWSIGGYSAMVVILIALFLPESPSYFIANKNYTKAYGVIENIARVNDCGKELMNYEDFVSLVSGVEKGNSVNQTVHKITPSSYVFHSKSNAYKVFALSLMYFSLALTYYGVSLGITSIGDMNPYLIYLLSSVAEVIGYMLCHLNDKFRRKYVFISFLVLASITCLLVAVLPNEYSILINVFALIGKAMASGAFNISYNYSSSMFPAIIRSTMSLTVSSLGRTGSIISPLINLLGKTVWKPLPYLIFSTFSFIGCLIIASLPEPNGFE
ncbi:unnamed protein product [Brachionus calyciflorus]|uniref:Major facilitator superfamily (MFS) profile domain-containing protein n=1 Tax=Brachionus calyciflorus TaxID=104777 RepID=A0A814J5F7_9BILA|nr:unnamed protein product [Brachionus calyciflorus]